ncbi:MAG: DUF1192 domain-containing protein [Pseudomonadota bacterium]
MDADEPLARSNDPLALVAKQDLDPLSVAELEARIATLEAEIERTHSKMQRAVNHKASAASLFKS